MVSSSPGLIAAAHVLLRLLAPRHPPCALSLLIVKNTVVAAMEFSRCAAGGPRTESNRLEGRSLKTQQREDVEVDVVLGDPVFRTTEEVINGPGASGVRAPDSLERR
jgi:hypothetical protein